MKRLKLLSTMGLTATLLFVWTADASARRAEKPTPGKIDTKWLTQPGERAVLNNQFAQAAVLYQGALSLSGNDPDLLWRLAQIYTMGGQLTLAQDTYRRFVAVCPDAAKKQAAQGEISRLANMPTPFVSEDVAGRVLRHRTFAMRAFKMARKFDRKRDYKTAIRYYEAALVMDATLVGVFRLLGAAYGKLRDKAQEQAFYIQYLRTRPGGQAAHKVRQRLKGNKTLGRVTFTASFPCSVYVNRLAVDSKRTTPLKNILLPEGRYTVILYNAKYHVAKKIQVTVQKNTHRNASFDFGILSVQLKPWARVQAKRILTGGRGAWRDLGLWDEIGLPSGRYSFRFKTDDGTKKMTINVNLKPGQRLVVDRWK